MFRRFAVLSSITVLVSGCVFDDINKEPNANPVNLGTFDGTSDISISAAQIMQGASDPDNDQLTITNFVLARGVGQLSEVSDGNWVYQVSLADLGDVQFNYTVSDGTLTKSSSVNLEIENGNRLRVTQTDPNSVAMSLNANGATLTTLKATLTLDGENYSVNSSNGNVTFIGLPNNTEYYVTLEDSTGVLATQYVSNVTPVSTQSAVQNLTIEELTTPAQTVLTATNVLTNTGVKGLKPYINTNEIAAQNGRLISVEMPKLYAVEGAENYQFALTDNGHEHTVNVDELIDASENNYTVFNSTATTFQGRVIAGQTLDLNLTPVVAEREFNVQINLLDVSDQAINLGKFLAVYNIDKNETEQWEVDADVDNQYKFTMTADNLNDTRVVAAIDVELDGEADYSAILDQDNPLGLIKQLVVSDFDGDETKVFNVKMAPPADSSAIDSALLSSQTALQTGALGQIAIAFDRPVTAPDFITMQRLSLSSATQTIELNNPASIYQQNRTTRTSTSQGQSTSSLNSSNRYAYINESGQNTTLTISTSGSINSPYVTNLVQSSSNSTLNSSQFRLEANGTLLVITPSPSSLIAENQYSFVFSATDAATPSIAGSFSYSQFVRSNEAEVLEDFTVDNFNSRDTETYSPTSSEDILSGQEQNEGLFAELNVTYGSGNSNALLNYLSYNTQGFPTLSDIMTEIGINSSGNTLYLVTETPVEGQVTLLSQTETYLSGGSPVTTKSELNSAPIQLTADQSANASAFVVADKVFSFNLPLNEGIARDVVVDTYAAQPVTGANLDSTGVYYVYALPVSSQFNGQVTVVELSFDVSVNGARRIGTVEYPVK